MADEMVRLPDLDRRTARRLHHVQRHDRAVRRRPSDWRFALVSDIGQPGLGLPGGWLADDEGHLIVVRHMLPPPGTPAFVVKALHGVGPGMQFELDGRIIGGVDMISGGLVRLRDDLPPETRFALASLSTALMLRPRGD